MPKIVTFSARDKQKACEREASWRKIVYEKQVNSGSKTREAADRGIAIMLAMAEDFRTIADREDASERLI